MRGKFINKQGITLIALIITIVVMLILAGVAISVITDGGGLFSKVSVATKEHKKQSIIEGIRLAEMQLELDNEFDKTKTFDIDNLILKVEQILDTNEQGYTVVVNPSIQTAIIVDEKNDISIKVTIDESKNVVIGENDLDTVAPKAFNLIIGTTTQTTLSVNGSTEDGEETNTSVVSGILGYQYRIGNGEWSKVTNETNYKFVGLVAGKTYTVSMRAVDNAGNITEASNKDFTVTTSITNGTMADGSFDTIAGVNSPDVSGLPTSTTKYVIYGTTESYQESLSNSVPENWYAYSNGKWANLKTTSTDGSLEAYWVWIPRFAYRLPESGLVPKEIETTFVQGNGTTGANGEKCYYSTDTLITNNGTGLYTDATNFAKGTEERKEQAWIIHPAFTFGEKQLEGIWIAKYEPSSNIENDTEGYGGGNTISLNVEIKPNVTSWRYIQLANIFTVCRNIQAQGGALGTSISVDNEEANINTHAARKLEWTAVSVLSQSKYGIYNPQSSVGLVENGGDGTLKVWNNPNINYITGNVGTTPDDVEVANENCSEYNTKNGTKASTTGTIYGIYDMAAGATEYVMSTIAAGTEGADTQKPSYLNSHGYTESSPWPDKKYYDLYKYGTSSHGGVASRRAKIGDMTAEINPMLESENWNSDQTSIINNKYSVFVQGGHNNFAETSGIFSYDDGTGFTGAMTSFRPVLIISD